MIEICWNNDSTNLVKPATGMLRIIDEVFSRASTRAGMFDPTDNSGTTSEADRSILMKVNSGDKRKYPCSYCGSTNKSSPIFQLVWF